MLFGGYSSNVFYQDFWEYNIKANAWRQKKDFTIPLYPNTCVEDGNEALKVWTQDSVADVEQYVSLSLLIYIYVCVLTYLINSIRYTDRQCVALAGTGANPYDSIPPLTEHCVFPNMYQDTIYEACIPANVRPPVSSTFATETFQYLEDFPWCITSPMGTYPIKWGYCHCSSCDMWDDHYPCCRKEKDAPGIVAPSSCCPMNGQASDGTVIGAPKSVCNQALDLISCWDDYCYAGESDSIGNMSMSVWGQPTRFDSDLFEDLESRQLFVHQPRRQRPGWDGCRDRYDGRDDLPNELMWDQPTQRWNHKMLLHSNTSMIMLTGGVHHPRPEPVCFFITLFSLFLFFSYDSYFLFLSYDVLLLTQIHSITTQIRLDYTPEIETTMDVWIYDLNKCVHACSGHGSCVLGYCFCEDGYYGLDCSNTSCPGDYCYYDDVTWKLSCRHCCSSGSRPEPYTNVFEQLRVRKVPCSATEHGTENGICDGFGHCQCVPPMIGDDCSIRDCKNRCSGHGVCSMEFPQSRCICDAKWTGDDCSSITCLNNCSYPWGECTEGVCVCRDIMNPYNNTQVWAKYEGPDCSWITPFASASSRSVGLMFWILVLLVSVFIAT